MQQLETQLKAIPRSCLEICRDSLNKRDEVLTWFFELDSTQNILDDEMRAKLETYRQEGEESVSGVEALEQAAQQRAVEEALATLRALVAAAEKARLDHEEALQQHQQEQPAPDDGGEDEAQTTTTAAAAMEAAAAQAAEARAALEQELAQAQERAQKLEAQLNAAMAELRAAERRACAATDEVVAEHERFRIVTEQLGLMDGYLREERQHIRELESRLTTDEGRIQKVNAQMSSLEEQLRVREAAHEQRLQLLAEEARAQQEAARQLEAQKEALERRVQDLAALLAGKDSGDTIAQSQMSELRKEMEKELEKERELRKSAQEELEGEKSRSLELVERTTRLTEELRSAGNAADEASTALAQELDGMKQQMLETLRKVAALEEERVSQEEAVRKLETRQHRDREENQKLSAEVAQKERQLGESGALLREMRSKADAQRERLALLERQLAAARSTRPLERAMQQQQQQHLEFQKKVTELQNALKEVVRHNDELERAVVQKQQEVEQRERVMREQAKVLKVRDELIVLLKSKEQRQEEAMAALRDAVKEGDEAHEKTNAAMAEKADELQKLRASVEEKHKQVAALETLVKQLEEQQERSQAQRTRQEARISSLESLLQTQDGAAPERYTPPAAQASREHSAVGEGGSGSGPGPGPESCCCFFFWDGNELHQIERIPPGAAQNPAKGTFYLTVSPKPKSADAATADGSCDPASMQFYVTANIGAHDVEEGLLTAPSEETLARAADVAMTCAAYAAVRTGGRARESPAPAPAPTPTPTPALAPAPESHADPCGGARSDASAGWTTPVSQYTEPLYGVDTAAAMQQRADLSHTGQPHAPVAAQGPFEYNAHAPQQQYQRATANVYPTGDRNPHQQRPSSVPPPSASPPAHSPWLPRRDPRDCDGPRLRAGCASPRDPRSASPAVRGSRSASAPAAGERLPSSPGAAPRDRVSVDSFPTNYLSVDESRSAACPVPPRARGPRVEQRQGDSGTRCDERALDAERAAATPSPPPPSGFEDGNDAPQQREESVRQAKETAASLGWYPWTQAELPTTAAPPQHGDTWARRREVDFPLFWRRPAAPPDSDADGSSESGRARAPWFAFRSHAPAEGRERVAHSYVTLPGSDYSKDAARAQPQDVASGNRLPLRSNPSFNAPDGRMDGGEGASSHDATLHFSVDVEDAAEDYAQWAEKGARVQWGLPTIDEVNSESREHSEGASHHVSDADDDESSESVVSRDLSLITSNGGTCGTTIAEATNAEQAFDGGSRPINAGEAVPQRDDSRILDYWRSRGVEYSDFSSEVSTEMTYSPRSNDSFSGTIDSSSPVPAVRVSHPIPHEETQTAPYFADDVICPEKSQGVYSQSNHKTYNVSVSPSSRSQDSALKNVNETGATRKDPSEVRSIDYVQTSGASPGSTEETSMPCRKRTVRKCYTVFTSSVRNLSKSNLTTDSPKPTKLENDLNPYHKAFSNIHFSGKSQNKTDLQVWNNNHYQDTRNSFANVRHISDTSVLSPQENKAGIQLSATLFDIQRTAGASDSNINSSNFRKQQTGNPPRNHLDGGNQQLTDKHHKSFHIADFSALHDPTPSGPSTASVAHHPTPNTNHPMQFYKEKEQSTSNCSTEIPSSESPIHSPNSRSSNSRSRIPLSRYKPMRNILSKSCVAPDQNEKLNASPIPSGINTVHRHEHSCTNIIQQNVENLQLCDCRCITRHRPRSVPRCLSIDRYPTNQRDDRVSPEESDSLSEISYQLDQNMYDTEDSYETDSQFAYHDPIYLSMQCLESCDCHKKMCKHVHW